MKKYMQNVQIFTNAAKTYTFAMCIYKHIGGF